MTAKTTVKKAYGSTIFQRMCRNGHERTRADIRCAPALAADISDVNDGYFHPFVTVPPERTPFASARTSYLVHPFALSSPPRRASSKGFVPRTSCLVPRSSPPTLAALLTAASCHSARPLSPGSSHPSGAS